MTQFPKIPIKKSYSLSIKHYSLIILCWLLSTGIARAATDPSQASQKLLTEVDAIYKQLVLPIAAFLTGVMIVYSGILYASSEGQPEKIAKAKEYTMGAIAGFVLILVCGLIVKAVSPV